MYFYSLNVKNGNKSFPGISEPQMSDEEGDSQQVPGIQRWGAVGEGWDIE